MTEFALPICNGTGAVLSNQDINPGDVVSATAYLAGAYCGSNIGFGLSWRFSAVSLVATAVHVAYLEPPVTNVGAFAEQRYSFQEQLTSDQHMTDESGPKDPGEAQGRHYEQFNE